MNIRKGQSIEVLWTLGGCLEKKKVWWGALVCCVDKITRNSSGPCSAIIRYDALHGHEEADSNVTFISRTILDAVEAWNAFYRRHSKLKFLYASRQRSLIKVPSTPFVLSISSISIRYNTTHTFVEVFIANWK
jgi:hypothetical protein